MQKILCTKYGSLRLGYLYEVEYSCPKEQQPIVIVLCSLNRTLTNLTSRKLLRNKFLKCVTIIHNNYIYYVHNCNVDSISNRDEYQRYLLGAKAASA